MITTLEQQPWYLSNFICSRVPFFDDVFTKNYAGKFGFSTIQDTLQTFSDMIHDNDIVNRRKQTIQFHADSGAYQQRHNLEVYDYRYSQFGIVFFYSGAAAELITTIDGAETLTTLDAHAVYAINNQVPHAISTLVDNTITLFCFKGSYHTFRDWYDQLQNINPKLLGDQ